MRDSATAENSVLVQTVDDPGDYGDAPVALEMRAGWISLDSDWILRGSEPNRSNRRRCGLAMRYLSADVRAYLDWNTNSIRCRDTDPGGHWANHPRPPGETIPHRRQPTPTPPPPAAPELRSAAIGTGHVLSRTARAPPRAHSAGRGGISGASAFEASVKTTHCTARRPPARSGFPATTAGSLPGAII